jgi:hypothetical protein
MAASVQQLLQPLGDLPSIQSVAVVIWSTYKLSTREGGCEKAQNRATWLPPKPCTAELWRLFRAKLCQAERK